MKVFLRFGGREEGLKGWGRDEEVERIEDDGDREIGRVL